MMGRAGQRPQGVDELGAKRHILLPPVRRVADRVGAVYVLRDQALASHALGAYAVSV